MEEELIVRETLIARLEAPTLLADPVITIRTQMEAIITRTTMARRTTILAPPELALQHTHHQVAAVARSERLHWGL